MAGESDPYGVLTPDDFTYFQVQRRRIQDTYGQGLYQGMYQGSSLAKEKDRGLANLKRQYEQNVRKLPQAFARRGMLNSGLYNRAGYDLELSNRMATGDIQGRYDDQLAGIQLAGAQLGQTRDNALSDIDQQDAARRATAAAIRAGSY